MSYTFNLYGDIDNEERMQKFIDAVRRELEFNNARLGRSVELMKNPILNVRDLTKSPYGTAHL